MQATERTSSVISEALHGLRQIRLSSMERLWQDRIFRVRNENLTVAWKVSVLEQLVGLIAALGPVLFASVTISIYAFRTDQFSPSVAFTSINLFGNLHTVIKQLPNQFASLHRTRLCYSKFQKYIQQPEQTHQSISADAVSLCSADLAWTEDGNAVILRNVDVEFPKNGLSLLTGQVGSGKSLLLSALLDEAVVQSGDLGKPRKPEGSPTLTEDGVVAGSVALVAQPPWIEDRSVKENITFGCAFNRERYEEVLRACALLHDIAALKNGDGTLAGTAGASLSGGQKWRVALARALYSPAEIIISEDILAAVDTPIARHICDNALNGDLLCGRTMILATHHPEYCSALASCLVSIQNGSATTTYPQPVHQKSSNTTQIQPQNTELVTEKAESSLPSEGTDDATKQIVAHSRPQDYWSLLRAYTQRSGSFRGYIVAVPVVLCYRFIATSNSWWLAKWTSTDRGVAPHRSTTYDVGVYMLLSVGSAVFMSIQTLLFTRMGHDSSRKLFESLTWRVLKARLSWIDSTPPGQVVQTLNSDMYAIDHRMAPQIIGILNSIVNVIFICASR